MLTHICLSDLHAGAQNSLLMDQGQNGALSPVSKCFAAALQRFLAAANPGGAQIAPQLILLGDVLDLQFSDRRLAMQNATGFLKALKDTNQLAPNVVATAGNHDHALWTDARLGLEIDPNISAETAKATPAFTPTPRAQSRMLSAVLDQAGFGTVDFRYPNIGFANDDRSVLLHHGHFAEGEYLTISHLIDALDDGPARDLTVAEAASENGGWIDFLWPSISQTGHHAAVSDIYQMMLTPSGFRYISERLAKRLSQSLGEALPFSGNLLLREALHVAARVGLDVTVGKFRDTARFYEIAALSPTGVEDLKSYVSGPVARQICDELGSIPHDTTFIFGHTHKPFADRLVIDGFKAPPKVFNTGGWTLSGPRLDNREGAALVLIDDALHIASVQIFGTPHNGEIPAPSVTILDEQCTGAVAFKEEIESWLAASKPEWAALTQAAGEAYLRIQAKLLALTEAEIEKYAADGGDI